jgi:YD repeat-containing protein
MATCAFSGNTCSYQYGADGLRHQSTVNGVTTNYVLDASMFVREQRIVSGQPTNYATYLMGPRGPEYRRDDTTGNVRWYLYDGLGSVLGEVDPSGNVTASRKYPVCQYRVRQIPVRGFM